MGLLLDPDATRRIKVDQILVCEWIGMDPRLLNLNDAEKAAKMQAIDTKRNAKAKSLHKRDEKAQKDDKQREDLHVLKEASRTVFRLSDTMKPESQAQSSEVFLYTILFCFFRLFYRLLRFVL